MTRSMCAGTCSFRRRKSTCIRAATLIPRTATSGTISAEPAMSPTIRRNDCSASRPVTNRTQGFRIGIGFDIENCKLEISNWKNLKPIYNSHFTIFDLQFPSPDGAAIGVDDLPGDVTRLIARQEPCQPGDVVGRPPAGQRRFAQDAFLP